MRDEYIRDFGEELGLIIYPAYTDWVEAAYMWQELSDLVKSEGRVKLLKEVCPVAFRNITKCMLVAIVLSVCRLTDPSKDRNNTNISVQHLKSDSDMFKQLRGETQAKLQGLDLVLEKALVSATKLRHLRHKRIAHKDAVEHVKVGKGEVEIVTMLDVKSAIDDIHSVFAFISYRLQGADLINEVIGSGKGTSALLYCLAQGHVMHERILTRELESNEEIESEIRSILN